MDIPKSKFYSLIPEATDKGNLIVLYSTEKYCPFKMTTTTCFLTKNPEYMMMQLHLI